MISFSPADIIIIILFFIVVLTAGFYPWKKSSSGTEDYLLSGRKVGLFLFVLTSVSTWYGGILGVGEFTYRYGIASWFTQGFPYYVFAFLFALFFAGKIRNASLFTIPDKITEIYGRKAGIISAVFVFILVSPAPYLLMTANLISLIFNIDILPALFIGLLLSIAYLLKGGFRSDIYTDAVQFFFMFGGFILIVLFSFMQLGGSVYLSSSLPENHLKLTGGASPLFIVVWFLIALWTFADPGFHQRCYSAKDSSVARKGIIISILFWALFDFLTTVTGLYARAFIPDITLPVLAFPLFADKLLTSGFKGIFFAAMFATIMSTLNSFLFLSGTTIGRDFVFRLAAGKNENKLKGYVRIGLLISGILSVMIAWSIPSVIEIWYTIGSLFIPGIIIPVITSYYTRFKVAEKFLLAEMILSVAAGITWFFIRGLFDKSPALYQVEPMLAGLFFSLLIHLYGLAANEHFFFYAKEKK